MQVSTSSGARLSYVVVALEGTVKREVVKWDKRGGGITRKTIEEPAGFMVYFPRGHAIRFKDKTALAAYGLDREPRIINLQGLSDPNSAIGKMLMAQDEGARRGAMLSLEQQVIQLATAKTGPMLMPEQLNQNLPV